MRKRYRIYIFRQVLVMAVLCVFLKVDTIVQNLSHDNTTVGRGLKVVVLVIVIVILWLIFYLANVIDNIVNKRPQPLENAVVSNHGEDILSVISGLRDETVEYLAIFNLFGMSKITEQTQFSSLSVKLNKELCPEVPAHSISVHCHPSVEESSFSDQDFYAAVSMKIRTDIVVTLHHIYVMHYNNDEIIPREIGNFSNKVINHRIYAFAYFFPALHRWISIYKSHKVAKEFGLQFYHYRL